MSSTITVQDLMKVKINNQAIIAYYDSGILFTHDLVRQAKSATRMTLSSSTESL